MILGNSLRERDRALKYIYLAWDTDARKMYRAGGLPKEGEGDFANDVFIIFEERIRKGGYDSGKDKGNGLKGYYLRICTHTIANLKNPERDRYAKDGKRNTIPIDDPRISKDADPANAARLVMREECADIVRDLLDQLGQKCKQMLLLYYLDLSRRQIREHMNLPTEGAVGVMAHKCVAKWRTLFENNPHLKTDPEIRDCWEYQMDQDD